MSLTLHRSPTPKPVRACLFGVDGLLINSEDIYIDIFNEILRPHKALPWTIKAIQQSQGDEVRAF